MVRVALKDGRVFTETEEYNRGSAENPMSEAELRAKFDDNAGGVLAAPPATGLPVRSPPSSRWTMHGRSLRWRPVGPRP